MLDAHPAHLTKTGKVTIEDGLIVLDGFDSEGGTCRDLSALALCWAIGVLQEELSATLERPGNSRVVVD